MTPQLKERLAAHRAYGGAPVEPAPPRVDVGVIMPANPCGISVAANRNIEMLRRAGFTAASVSAKHPSGKVILQQITPGEAIPPYVLDRPTIGYWVVESSIMHPSRVNHANALVQIWTASKASQAAILAAGVTTPVHVVPHPVVMPRHLRTQEGHGGLRLLTASAPCAARKNVMGTIAAFWLAFPPGASERRVSLTVKLRGACEIYVNAVRGMIAGDSRIRLVAENVSDNEMLRLYQSHDAFVQLNNAGAFELHCAEAAVMGMPVLTTDVGGVKDYLPDSCLIPSSEVPAMGQSVVNSAGSFFAPSIMSAVTMLRKLADPEYRRVLGEACHVKAAPLLDPEGIVETAKTLVNKAMRPLSATRLVKVDAYCDFVGGAPEKDSLVIASHRRSGTHLAGELARRNFGRPWIKTHAMPEIVAALHPGRRVVYVLRDPADCIYSTWIHWTTGGAQNMGVRERLAGLSFSDYLDGKAGDVIGYGLHDEGVRDNMAAMRGMFYDPVQFWVDHVAAWRKTDALVVWYHDLVDKPDAVAAEIGRRFYPAEAPPLVGVAEKVGIGDEGINPPGYARPFWPQHHFQKLQASALSSAFGSIICAIMLTLSLASCSLGPSYLERTGPDGVTTRILTAGGSVLTNTEYEETVARKGDLVLEHRVWRKDETALPRYELMGEAVKAGAEALEPVAEGIGNALSP